MRRWISSACSARISERPAGALRRYARLFRSFHSRLARALLYTAPGSYQVHELNAEALEAQGKWDDAAAEYAQVLKQNPRLAGMHYRLGRLMLSGRRRPPPNEEARREFQAELEIDPTNAGAEYVLGELARQDEQFSRSYRTFRSRRQAGCQFRGRLHRPRPVADRGRPRRRSRSAARDGRRNCSRRIPRRITTWPWLPAHRPQGRRGPRIRSAQADSEKLASPSRDPGGSPDADVLGRAEQPEP